MKTAYEVLGVPVNATSEEIKKQYHTLMRNLHADIIFMEDEEEVDLFSRVQEYNKAYESLKNEKSHNDRKKIGIHFQQILQSGYSFFGSMNVNELQKKKQSYWRMKTKKALLECQFVQAENDAKIAFMKRSSTNEIQLGLELSKIDSDVRDLESKRKLDLEAIQQKSILEASKRIPSDRKKEQLKKKAEKETERVNAKYNLSLEKYRQKKVKIERKIEMYQVDEKEFIEKNEIVKNIKEKIVQIQKELDAMEKNIV